MVAEQLLHDESLQPKTEKFLGELLHTLASERQKIHELAEKMFVVGAISGFALGVLTIGSWSLMRI